MASGASAADGPGDVDRAQNRLVPLEKGMDLTRIESPLADAYADQAYELVVGIVRDGRIFFGND